MLQYQPQKLTLIDKVNRPVMRDITVIIPTLGRPVLEESLHWIVSGDTWPYSIIVVDQGPKSEVDGWIETLRYFGIRAEHVISDQRGRAAGINRGLERLQTRFVAITDDDCFVDANWLYRMTNQLREQPETIVTGRVEALGESVISVVTSRVPAVYRRPRLKFDSMSGGNMGTSQSVIRRVGLFDEAPYLRTAEDAEWAYRALRAGVPIVYTPEVVVRHLGWRDERNRAIQYRDYARSHGGFYGKYLRQGDWFIALRALVHHGRALRRWLSGTAMGDREHALFGWSYLTGLLPGIIAGMKRN